MNENENAISLYLSTEPIIGYRFFNVESAYLLRYQTTYDNANEWINNFKNAYRFLKTPIYLTTVNTITHKKEACELITDAQPGVKHTKKDFARMVFNDYVKLYCTYELGEVTYNELSHFEYFFLERNILTLDVMHCVHVYEHLKWVHQELNIDFDIDFRMLKQFKKMLLKKRDLFFTKSGLKTKSQKANLPNIYSYTAATPLSHLLANFKNFLADK